MDPNRRILVIASPPKACGAISSKAQCVAGMRVPDLTNRHVLVLQFFFVTPTSALHCILHCLLLGLGIPSRQHAASTEGQGLVQGREVYFPFCS